MNKKFYVVLTMITITLFTMQITSVKSASETNYSTSIHHESETAINDKTDMPQEQISQKKIVDLTNQFMDMLVQDIDTQFKVTNFNTKNELLDAFESISSREVAARYVDYYYYEKQNGLYIVPTETPPWFNEANDYDMIIIDDNKIKVVQDNNSGFYGDYTLSLQFTFDHGWKITKVDYS